MAGLTPEQIDAALQQWYTVLITITNGKSISFNGRQYTSHDLAQVQGIVDHLNKEAKKATRTGIKVNRAIPTD